MPAYMRGRGATPSVPLLGPEADAVREGDAAREGEASAVPELDAAEASPVRVSKDENGPQEEAESKEGIGSKQGVESKEEAGRKVVHQTESASAPADREASVEEGRADVEQTVEPVPHVSETGESEQVEVYGQSLRLQGRTRARFGNSFRTVDVVTEPGEGCRGCRKSGCVHVTGTLESTYNVTTSVTLPTVASQRRLTPCQRERVQDAIDNVLAPHEQEHVDAFNTYNGTTSTPFDMTICRTSFNARIRALHNADARARRAAAQALSDALDPFFFDVDLDCEETAANEPEHTPAGA